MQIIFSKIQGSNVVATSINHPQMNFYILLLGIPHGILRSSVIGPSFGISSSSRLQPRHVLMHNFFAATDI